MKSNGKEIKRTPKKQIAQLCPEGYQSAVCEKLDKDGDGQIDLA